MWRRVFVSGFLKQSVSAAAAVGKHSSPTPSPFPFLGLRPFECSSSSSSSIDFSLRPPLLLWRFTNTHPFSSPSSDKDKDEELKASIQSKPPIIQGLGADNITSGEAKKMMRLVNVEALKMKLGMEEKEVIGYKELLEACESMGVARTEDEAIAFARVLDEAGVVLLFRDKVYLHPDKVVDLVKRAMPIALTPEDDPVRDELKLLLERKEEIDVLAHKQVRRILYFGLGLSILQIGLFFRLTFWEFSWDVMEPIAFFTTTAGIIVGYGYFLFTARDPTYQDLMKRLFISRQRKLFKKHNFDVNRFKELQAKLKNPLDARASIKNRFGLDLEIEDALHRD